MVSGNGWLHVARDTIVSAAGSLLLLLLLLPA
jgi:hypothetical protein